MLLKFDEMISPQMAIVRPEVNSNWFETSNRFEMSFRLRGNLHGDFTVATFQTMCK